MAGLDFPLSFLLCLCFGLSILFVFINGFHDTANSVTTVIYTNTLGPTLSVVYSGVLNFIGVLTGGIAVAAGIVNLLPAETYTGMDMHNNAALVVSLLISAITWNFGTWYYGIPSSSSHAVIGSVLGIGFAYYFIPQYDGPDPVNWVKARETLLFLFITPVIGFLLSLLVMFLFRTFIKNDLIFKEPIPGQRPPMWIRGVLLLTCGSVSFVHGQNDGQKGVGLVLLILLAFLPAGFSLKPDFEIGRIVASADKLGEIVRQDKNPGTNALRIWLLADLDSLKLKLTGHLTTEDVPGAQRPELRQMISGIARNASRFRSETERVVTKNEVGAAVAELRSVLDFAPGPAVIAVAIALGIGTMVGWKRIVKTMGEKIGKQYMSYAQGASAEIVASMGIGLASFKGISVSTTHMVTSGIAGSMVSGKGFKNLQRRTAWIILVTWLLTLPATMMMSAALFLILRNF